MQWVKFNLEKKLHCVFVNVSESFVLLSRHKIDVKEDLISKHDVNKNVDTVHKMKFSITNFFSKCDQILNAKLHFLCSETFNSYTRKIMQILLIQPEICCKFHYHLNINTFRIEHCAA